MTPQKSEDRIVPQGRRKPSETQPVESAGGGKAIPVKEEDQQLMLSFASAENPPRQGGAEGAESVGRSTRKARKAPKAKANQEKVDPARMEEVIERLEQSPAASIT